MESGHVAAGHSNQVWNNSLKPQEMFSQRERRKRKKMFSRSSNASRMTLEAHSKCFDYIEKCKFQTLPFGQAVLPYTSYWKLFAFTFG